MADKKANQGTTITPEARVSNNIVRVSNEDGTAGNGLKIPLTDFSLRDIQTTRNACIALLASSGAAITTGQGYVFDGAGGAIPSGLSLIRIRGIDLTLGAKGFSSNAEAYVTALGVYVPCTYDVATNKIYAKVPVYAINLTQTDGGTTNTVNKTFVNLLGETPVITRIDDGVINFNTTTFAFVEHQTLLHPVIVYDSGSSALYSPVFIFNDANNIRLRMTRCADGAPIDDIYNNTYLEFYILIAN